ncbi:hypothetical protein B0G57_12290 [Trinickia symbiotica]|uniref:Uncharacterized protein n=1 Tax=Trinickia symbiotica TaxID=863227 RepID=A0A2N7X986_9BURK|nr:hypothetical protein [Trinickia symbiotica]PMS38326.1 hypothetical protein C0Z20_00035 [Trinickia symbiotica]PPK42081.1 hypothetical protein B0G57_12290 [Trinickia symbiotica]
MDSNGVYGLHAAVLVAMTSVSFCAAAADFPKRGEAEFDTYATVRTLGSIDSGAGTGGVWDYSGVIQNVKGDGPFNNMVVRCLQNWTTIAEQFRIVGSCVLTDPDGDSIFDVFEATNFELVAGIGKYKGISGHGSITRTRLHDLPGGARGLVNHHTVAWEIK